MKFMSKAELQRERKRASFKSHVNIASELRVVQRSPGNTVVEFINTDSFARAWYERQRFEVDAGRDEEPLLYTPFYSETIDPSFPRHVSLNRIGPAAVVFEEVTEGGEVKFVTVGNSTIAIPIKHYAMGLEYTKDLQIFNELWSMTEVERQAGTAFNALLNHIHLSPIINYSYAAANQTAASASGTTLVEKYIRTLEDAITSASTDTANPRRGPYAILTSMSNYFTLRRALSPVPQQGVDIGNSEITPFITALVGYDGWSGMRGKKATSYAGVTANKAYLVDVSNRPRNFKSLVKQPLQRTSGNEDVSRFILEQEVWDTYFGVFADPLAAVEEITLPTS